jgi:phenylacetate-CoA ligase
MVVLWSRPVAHTRWTNARAWAVNRLRNAVQFDAFAELDDAKAARVADAIERHRPTLLYGYGSSLGKLADLLHARGRTISPAARPRLIEYTADHMYAPERRTATEVFGAQVVSAYGSSECGGVAQQCPEGRLHVSMDHVVVEFLRADGSRADPGETARLVVTHLNNFGMPLLRYEVGDAGAYVDDPCPCGVTLPCMSLQVGKSVDVIDTSEKCGVSAHVFDYINLHLVKLEIRGIKQFYVEQTSTDSFDVAFVREQPFDGRSVDIFVEKMREYLGNRVDVQTRFVDEIPLTPSGKRRYFKKRMGIDREASGS